MGAMRGRGRKRARMAMGERGAVGAGGTPRDGGRAGLGRLRRQARARLEGLDVPEPFDLTAWCARVARRRGRPIVLHPVASPPGVCGMWVAVDGQDHVFFERDTTALHRDHIVLHELSHMLCEHRSAALDADGWAVRLLPDIDPETVRRVLRRAVYSDEEEREAEVLATLITERAVRGPHLAAAAADEVAVLQRRLGAALAVNG